MNLLIHDEDADDVHLPLRLWWAIEAKAETNRDAILAMFGDKSLWEKPLVRKHLLHRLMRRYAQAGTRNDLLACAQLFELSPDKASTSELMNTPIKRSTSADVRPVIGEPTAMSVIPL